MKSYSLQNDIHPLMRLAIPIALTGMVQSAIWFFETMFLSRLGEETLAAGAIVSWLFGTIAVILFGVLSAINIMVAHKHGAKDNLAIQQIARDGLLLAISLTIPTMIILWNIAPVFLLLGQSQAVVEQARTYLQALVFGLPAIFLGMACLEVIIGVGIARTVLIFTTMTVIFNIISSYILIFGKFGFPALGIAGAGWGLTIGNWFTLFILIGFILINKKQRYYFSHIFNFDSKSYFGELFIIGFPTGVMYCVEVAFFFALTLLMGQLGTQTQAANQVALQYLNLMISTMFAVSQAITVRMGHLLGARDVNSAEKASYIGVILGLLFSLIIAVPYWFFPHALISIDFDVQNPANTGIVNEITAFLSICAIFQIVEAARVALFGALRGLKETRFTMLTSIISFWCVALPVGYLLAIQFAIGGTGYWWGMILGATVSVVMLLVRFRKKIRQYQPHA